MIFKKRATLGLGCLLWAISFSGSPGGEPGESGTFEPFVWPSNPPTDCPFEQSKDLAGLRFAGKVGDYRLPDTRMADTWYPVWASDGNLYSPYTDGRVPSREGPYDRAMSFSTRERVATTGQAVLIGDDPLKLQVYSLGVTEGDPTPYRGRYPCGSLVHNGIWYYGTYCLGPEPLTYYGGKMYNWPWLGPLVGFRISRDLGKTWVDCPQTPAKPLFPESGMWGHSVKMGSPHFVDLGKNMEYSPDGKAYLVAHGAVEDDQKPRFANLSWISGDQVYLARVSPSPETINNEAQYEYFAGYDERGVPKWSWELEDIRPLLEWNNHMGCVTITYDAPLRKYLMCVTDGWPTVAKMDSYILEADAITGPWRLVTYMKEFGEQAYFLNFPSKFISPDGHTLWLCYSANFTSPWKGNAWEDAPTKLRSHPPGSYYGLVLQQVRLLKANEEKEQ